jgi:drug/metabolite transporter (DMT)-like permease
LRLADVSLLAPFSYLQLLIVAALAWWIFGEEVNRHTVAGAAIIIGASLYIAQREHSLARQRRRALPAARAEPPI